MTTLFNELCKVADSFPNKPALNNLTFSQLIRLINNSQYVPISNKTNYLILIDIFKASQVNKPIIIPPLKGNYDIPLLTNNFSLFLYSSGSSGNRKHLQLNEEMILANAENSIKVNKLNEESRIFTICTLNHTGGLNAQTIPALLCGAYVYIDESGLFQFEKTIKNNQFTHTHITPKLSNTLQKMKFNNLALEVIMCGSDCVFKTTVEFWLQHTNNFIINYGLTEAGPIIINHTFTKNSNLDVFNLGVLLGTQSHCQTKIIDGELFLKGKCIINQDWLATGDCVELNENWFVYKGRKSAGCKIIPKSY
jgi:acyl-CoA synthetase (AMP-forming)/AMP-acid ligase II